MSGNMEHEVLIEVDRNGVLAVHADVGDTQFVHSISPAIMRLDQSIRETQAVISSRAFRDMVTDASEKLETAPAV